MNFFETDFGTIVLWVLAGIVLIPLTIGALVAALAAVFFTVFKIVWIVAKLAAIILIVSGVVYIILYFSGNLALI